MTTPLLEIKNLYACVDNKEIIKGLNLTINEGEVHAIMGPNGAGKSSLSYVLSGKDGYEVTSGEILIDDVPIKNMSLKSLRQKIGLVQQDVFLFAGTIKVLSSQFVFLPKSLVLGYRYGKTRLGQEQAMDCSQSVRVWRWG